MCGGWWGSEPLCSFVAWNKSKNEETIIAKNKSLVVGEREREKLGRLLDFLLPLKQSVTTRAPP